MCVIFMVCLCFVHGLLQIRVYSLCFAMLQICMCMFSGYSVTNMFSVLQISKPYLVGLCSLGGL